MTAKKHTYTILLIDDDRFLLDMYSVKFSAAGHEVLACFSVDEALSVLSGSDEIVFDGIVFDIAMPKADGFDLLTRIKDEHLAPRAALIALTNQAADEDLEKVKALGAHEYIVKASAIPSEVVNMVERTIAAHHAA